MDYRVYCKMKNPPCFLPNRREDGNSAQSRGRRSRSHCRNLRGNPPQISVQKNKIPLSSDILKLFSIFSRRMKY